MPSAVWFVVEGGLCGRIDGRMGESGRHGDDWRRGMLGNGVEVERLCLNMPERQTGRA